MVNVPILSVAMAFDDFRCQNLYFGYLLTYIHTYIHTYMYIHVISLHYGIKYCQNWSVIGPGG